MTIDRDMRLGSHLTPEQAVQHILSYYAQQQVRFPAKNSLEGMV